MKNHFLLLFLCFSTYLTAQSPQNQLLLQSGELVLSENVADYITAAKGNENCVAGVYYRLLQFKASPSLSTHEGLRDAGIQLLEYIPHHAYIAAIPQNLDLEILKRFDLRAISKIETPWKVSKRIDQHGIPSWAEDRNQLKSIIKYHKNLDHEEVLKYCLFDQINVIAHNGYNNFIEVSFPKNRLEEIAALPYIAFVDLIPSPAVKDDTPARSLHRANMIDSYQANGRKFSGEGVGVLIRDDGIIGPHIDFHGRLSQEFASVNGNGTHGDGVAGILAGCGNFDPLMVGNARGADVYTIDYLSTFLDETMDLHFDNGVLVTNSSYSDGCNEGYTTTTETVDQQIYDNPSLMHVFSAGNSNGADCYYGAGDQWGNITGGHKQGKNVIATANLFFDASLVGSSSHGPAHDGRIKPDIAANGQEQISTFEDNNYGGFGGTSGAAPNIAGIVAMMHQAYRALNGGSTAQSALLKAMILNTANDLGNVGPDFIYGWGHVNAHRAVSTIEDERYFNANVTVGEVNNHSFTVPPNVKELRIMTYWMDNPGSVMTNRALVNDIDVVLKDPNSDSTLPWILDSSPDPVSLNNPAIKGEDHLNNMEQIFITDPEEGSYTLEVKGTDLPFGAQDYFVVWEYRMDDVTLIYPIGGEELVPGEEHIIHWDAQSSDKAFEISYSSDGGSTYNPINTLPGTARLLSWIVPNEINAASRIKISNGISEDASTENFHIGEQAFNLSTEAICPTEAMISWEGPAGAAGYQVFMLGDKYMEVIGSTTDTEYAIPLSNPNASTYAAIRTVFPNGAYGRRTIAYPVGGTGLTNCDQENNISLVELVSVFDNVLFPCEATFEEFVTIRVQNQGTLAQDNVPIAMSVNNSTIIRDTITSTIDPGQYRTWTFGDPLNLDQSGNYQVEIWTDLPNETAQFDDSTQFDFSLLVGSGFEPDLTESFEGPQLLPDFWLVQNPDLDVTWEKRSVVQSDGTNGTAMFVNFFNYNSPGARDNLSTPPLNFSNNTGASILLTFDYAYSTYPGYDDAFHVELSTDCGATFSEVLFSESGADLETFNTTNFFTPDNANQWRNIVLDLTTYGGMSNVMVRFVSETGWGNNLYVDNINIIEVTLSPPVAEILASTDSICPGDTIIFESLSTGGLLDYQWLFQGGSPTTANTAGPHAIRYIGGGNRTAQLIVNNPAGTDTTTFDLFILPRPSGSFSANTSSGLEVQYNANLMNTDSVSWDFGDGNSSSEINPLHTYTITGVYSVSMTLFNDCGTRTYTQMVTVVLTSIDGIAVPGFNLYPNPNSNYFTIEADEIMTGSVELYSIDGKKMMSQILADRKIEINHELKAGVYILQLVLENGSLQRRVIVQ